MSIPQNQAQSPLHESITSQQLSEKTSSPHSSKSGWDGKLRVEKKAQVKNAEALESDGEFDSEDELPGEQIEADEGIK